MLKVALDEQKAAALRAEARVLDVVGGGVIVRKLDGPRLLGARTVLDLQYGGRNGPATTRPVSPAAFRIWRNRAPSSLRACAPELVGSVATERRRQSPDALERFAVGSHRLRVVAHLERGIGAVAGVVQEQHQPVVEDVEVPASRQEDVGEQWARHAADVLAGVDEQVDVAVDPATASRGVVGAPCHDPGVAIVRYRYRAYPTAGQEQVLARAFGCARVVFNDCLRLRQAAYAAGEKLSDTEVQRRVVTQRKRTLEREWLGEVASVALVQACQDARRAYRNWFDSLSGKRGAASWGRRGSGRSGTIGSRSGSPATASPSVTTAGCMWRRSGTCAWSGRGRCRRSRRRAR